jgi:hypothetical protein
MSREPAKCDCGKGFAESRTLQCVCPWTDVERAKMQRARKATGAKLWAMVPSSIKAGLFKAPKPFKFIPDRKPIYPYTGANTGTISPPHYEQYIAHGGPFDGQSVELSDNSGTAEIKCSGMRGRYVLVDTVRKTQGGARITEFVLDWQEAVAVAVPECKPALGKILRRAA